LILPIKTRSINSLSKYLHNHIIIIIRSKPAIFAHTYEHYSNPWISKPVFLNFNGGN
jgi:hypothetical protein